jgi:hypothetical protein
VLSDGISVLADGIINPVNRRTKRAHRQTCLTMPSKKEEGEANPDSDNKQ